MAEGADLLDVPKEEGVVVGEYPERELRLPPQRRLVVWRDEAGGAAIRKRLAGAVVGQLDAVFDHQMRALANDLDSFERGMATWATDGVEAGDAALAQAEKREHSARAFVALVVQRSGVAAQELDDRERVEDVIEEADGGRITRQVEAGRGRRNGLGIANGQLGDPAELRVAGRSRGPSRWQG